MSTQLAVTLDQVKFAGTALTLGFSVLSAASAWLMKTMAKKVTIAVIFGILAVVVWTQREAATGCASDAAANVGSADTSCTFLGIDVTIPTGLGS